MEKSKLAAAMFIVGSIGLFVHYIPLPPAVIACARAVIGTLFLLLVLRLKKTPLHGQAIRKNALCLLLSGAALGFNWIFSFSRPSAIRASPWPRSAITWRRSSSSCSRPWCSANA